MPTYTSTNKTDVYGADPYTRFAASTTTITQRYVSSIPTGVTLTSHSPVVRPWDLLVAAESGLIDVSAWRNIILLNTGDDTATVSANTDDENALSITAGAKEVFDNSEGLFGCLEVLTGTVSVWGCK